MIMSAFKEANLSFKTPKHTLTHLLTHSHTNRPAVSPVMVVPPLNSFTGGSWVQVPGGGGGASEWRSSRRRDGGGRGEEDRHSLTRHPPHV